MKKYVEINGEKIEVKKAKKPFYKRIWVWGLGIVVVSMIASGGNDEPTKTAPTKDNAPVAENAPAKEKASTNDPGISKAEFDKIQNGMSYEEVVAIIGGKGTVQSETGNKGEQFHTILYAFDGESGLGANASLMFQEDKLENKSQFGLE